VEPRRPNPHHSADDDLLSGYALGILTPAERAEIEARLTANPALREELALLNVAVDALPLGLEPREPSPGLRVSLEAAIQADLAAAQPWPAPLPATTVPPTTAPPAATTAPRPPAPAPRPLPARPRGIPINAWAIAAAVLLVIATAAVLWGIQQTRLADQPTQVIAFEMTDAAGGATGELAYLEQPGVMVVTVNDLPPLSPDQVYELWLIPHDGAPIPAGVFGDTSARHALTGSPEDYQAVAITVESGPLGTTAPTTEPLAVAPLGPAAQ
jgi:anti-sigma-K factor RskA